MNTRITSCLWSRHLTALSVIGLLAAVSAPAVAQTRPSIAALQAQIATLQAQVVPNLAGYVTMDLSNANRPTLRVVGANLQVVNGLGSTGTVNGLGNLIVGYDEADLTLPAVCSLGEFADQPSCVSGGGQWLVVHKSGSHNVVVGANNRYSRTGGLVAGFQNTINGDNASVTAGITNTASGEWASVSGGEHNIASGTVATVSGGDWNQATGDDSAVSGGYTRTAPAQDDWAAGGLFQDR